MISSREEGCPEPVLFRDICSPSLPLRKWPGVTEGVGGVGAWGDGGARCSSSAGPHTLEAALYLCSSERKEGRGMETACDKGSFLKTHRV